MSDQGSTVFVFDRDGEGMAFRSLDQAAAYMEAIDALDGEYVAAFTLAGQAVSISAVRDGRVALQLTGNHDAPSLRAHLVLARSRMKLLADADDPRAVANEMLCEEWRHLWPRRPAWLHRRFHGVSPPKV